MINLGSNFEISIGETAEMIAKLMGVRMEVLTEEQRLRPEKSEVERLWADNTKAKNLLNWSPEYGGQEDSVVDWKRQLTGLSSRKICLPIRWGSTLCEHSFFSDCCSTSGCFGPLN